MSTDYRLMTRPELLSESVLLEILKSRCIEVPDVKALKKADLVEMFRRVALPMPQRRYNEARYLGKKLNDLRVARKISIATEEEHALYKSAISSQNKSDTNSNWGKPSCEETNTQSKKRRVSSSSAETNGLPANGLKRRTSDEGISSTTEDKKRQKITWP